MKDIRRGGNSRPKKKIHIVLEGMRGEETSLSSADGKGKGQGIAPISKTAEALVGWCDAHPNCYPPTILHVIDGVSTDGDPESIASALQKISTGDGDCLLFNIHVSTQQGETVQFPKSDAALPDSYGKLLFRMSSVLPPHVSKLAADKGYKLSEGAKGFMFNADPKDIANFFDIGTRPRLTADR